MKCEVCGKPAEENSVVCSDKCQKIRLRLFKLMNKYAPTHGCSNCRGDLGGACTEECQREFRKLGKFATDLWSLIRLIYD